MGRLLFDDIPYLKDAQKEHDEFAEILRKEGVEVLYLEDLMAETLDANPELRTKFIKQFIYEAGIRTTRYKGLVYDYLNAISDNKALVLKTMEGINLDEFDRDDLDLEHSLVGVVSEKSKFIADPMPNLYFTRDPFACIGDGVSLNHMFTETRNRETIYGEYIFQYHPQYRGQVDLYYDRYSSYHVEGGDILNLNDHILAIGISQRTQPEAIEELAKRVFDDEDCLIDTILAFYIPNSRAFMHLDTVFTQIDIDKFTYHPGINETLRVYEITKCTDGDLDDFINVVQKSGNLEDILEEYLGIDVTLLPCAGGDKIASEREQWNDGSNTLCIRPGVVVVYDRNEETNQLLREAGLKVLELHGAELSRGRGGPRCMSMPFIRED